MIRAKHLYFDSVPRVLDFSYRITSLGYAFENPPLEKTKSVFPNKIEVCLRLLSEKSPPGVAKMRLGESDYEVEYPHALVKRPRESYIYHSLDVRNVFYFTYPSSSVGLFEKLGLFTPPLAWNISMTPELSHLLHQLHEYLNVSRNFGSGDRIDLACFQILAELLLMKRQEMAPPDPERELMMRMNSYFRLHFAEPISIEDVAREFGLSRTSFFRCWARYFKVSPARHLLELRLKEAVRLLEESCLKVSEIARRVNIRDPAYFCAVFRKEQGVQPLEYRRSCRSARNLARLQKGASRK